VAISNVEVQLKFNNDYKIDFT